MHKNRVFGLDVIRAMAISLVVVSHCTFILYGESNNTFLLGIRSLGAIGVDLFFVLSGYLIGGILLRQIEKNKTEFKDLLLFWKRRWYRTLPNYYLVLVINVLFLLFLDESLPDSILYYVPFLQNFTNPHPYFFTEAWSLSIEEYSYLILPLLLYLGLYLFKGVQKKQRIFIGVTISIIIFQFLFKLGYYFEAVVESYKDWSSTFRKVVIYRLDVIYYGFVLAYCHTRFKAYFDTYQKTLFFLSFLIFAVMHMIIYKFQILPETHLAFYAFLYLPLVAICCALVFPHIVNMKAIKPLEKSIYFLSTRSYAIYLVNYSIVLLNFKRIFTLEDMSLLSKVSIMALFLVVSVVLSEILYRYFEKPILDFRDRNY